MDKERQINPTPSNEGYQTDVIGSTSRGMWMGIGAVALIVFLALLFVIPGAEDGGDNRSRKVETTPAPNATPK